MMKWALKAMRLRVTPFSGAYEALYAASMRSSVMPAPFGVTYKTVAGTVIFSSSARRSVTTSSWKPRATTS